MAPFWLQAEFKKEDWQFRRRLTNVRTSGELSLVKLNPEVYSHTRWDFSDLRIVHRGAEVPFVIDTVVGGRGEECFTAANPVATQERGWRLSVFTLDLGVSGVPQDGLSVEVAAESFLRRLEVESSEDGKTWVYAGGGVIYRAQGREVLTVRANQPRGRYLRVRMSNLDDTAATVTRVAVFTWERRLKFAALGDGEYWMYYGNPWAGPPMYDLPLVLANGFRAAESLVTAGAAETNPDYQPAPRPQPSPLERRSRLIVFAGVGIGLVSLSLSACFVRAFRTLKHYSRYYDRYGVELPKPRKQGEAPAVELPLPLRHSAAAGRG